MKIKQAFFLGFIFFVAALLTLPNYGINWDTINHLPRGQSYLRFFLTGKKDYSELPKYFEDHSKKEQWYWQNPKSLGIDANIDFEKVPNRSVYQISDHDYNFFMRIDGDGHPPLSDILSAFFNRILFGELRLINDIDAYRVYGVLLASILVGLTYYWTRSVYGFLPAVIASLSLAMYPLFWAEAHFNTEKDVPQTAFWGFMLFCIWKGTLQKSTKWLLLSGVFFGLALGTKFNILFIPFVILPWVFLYILKNKKEFFSFKKSFKFVVSSFIAFLVGVLIFVATWPILWSDPIKRFLGVISFYKRLGVAANPDPRYLGPFGIITYPLEWIINTTPLVILILCLIGIVAAFVRIKKEKDLVSLLFLFWLIVPIARVIWNGSAVYGGIRQIMEFIPPMAILSGLGAKFLFEKIKFSFIKGLFLITIIVSYLMLGVKLYQIHPNENQFFNILGGGLQGAKDRDFPYWGFTLGSPYRNGIDWINKNAEKDASLVFVYELIPNIPRLWIRPDINFHNAGRSGYLAQGEYAMTLQYQGTAERSYYDTYLEKFVNPVYTQKVDGVSVLSVWKNDKAHWKKEIKEQIVPNVKMEKTKFGLKFDLGKIVNLWRLEINYNDKNCKPMIEAWDEVSKDDKVWQRIRWNLPEDWRISALGEQPKNGKFLEPFVGQEARYINLHLNPIDTCLSKVINFKVYSIE